MSRKIIHNFYVPVYRDLMSVTDYVQNFQSKSIGSMYMIIVSRVWRRGHTWTVGEGYFGKIEECAKEYDSGNLCANVDDKELAELLGVNLRHVRRMREQLVALGLVETRKEGYHGTGNYYRVGKVLSPGEYGRHNEALYIDRWLSEVEEQKENNKGVVNPEELEFVIKLREVLDYKKFKASAQASNVAADDHISRHGQPDSTEKVARENASTTEETEGYLVPYNNNRIKGTTSSSTTTVVAVQDSLFDETVDLSYINERTSPVELGRALLREHARVEESDLKGYLKSLMDKHKIVLDPIMASQMFYSTFVDAWFKKFPPPRGSKLSVQIVTWWKALSLDLRRPDLVAEPKKNTIVASKIEGVKNWYEFSFILRELFNNNGGAKFFKNFKHVTWLQSAVNKEVYKLTEFRSMVNVESLRNVKLVDVDEVQRKLDERLAQAAKDFGFDDDEDDELDIDDLLSLDDKGEI